MAGKGGRRPGAGRKKGIPNKITTQLKEAILQAAEQAGGEEGLIGYLKTQAAANPAPFLALLGRILPMQHAGEDGGAIKFTFTLDHAGSEED